MNDAAHLTDNRKKKKKIFVCWKRKYSKKAFTIETKVRRTGFGTTVCGP